jgi:hypothetical protein
MKNLCRLVPLGLCPKGCPVIVEFVGVYLVQIFLESISSTWSTFGTNYLHKVKVELLLTVK